MAKSAAQKKAEDAQRAKAAALSAKNTAKQAAAAAPAAKAAAAPPAPTAPARVDPFFTADDLDAINQFNTDLATKLEAIDTGLTNAETDTTYQKKQTDDAAAQNSSGAQDDSISRGIFQSSVKDATLYDIEAQRSLQSKFLDDKLATARLSAGSQKQTLATAKTNFDADMLKRQTANAQGVNDANSSAWASAQAAWAAANPEAAAALNAPPPPPPAPAKGVLRPTTTAPAPAAARPANQTYGGTGTTNSGSAIAAPKKPGKPKVVYGGRG